MSYQSIICSKKDHIGFITLNRPNAENRINMQMAQEMAEVCTLINQDEDLYLAVITGAGKLFSAGTEDSEERSSLNPAGSIAEITKPIIAAINGDCLGQGLEIALACDIQIAAEDARFGLPQIINGLIPSDGGTQRLPRIVGRGKALEMLFTGDTIDAKTAFEIGLVNRIFPAGSLAKEAEALAQAIASKAPIALRFAKEAVLSGLDLTTEQGLRLEADLYFLLHSTSDRVEGIKSFLAKKKPDFKGK